MRKNGRPIGIIRLESSVHSSSRFDDDLGVTLGTGKIRAMGF
jgi:hypothetical protein